MVPVLLGLTSVGVSALLAPDMAFAQCALCRDAVGATSPVTREAMNYAIMGLAFTPFGVAALAVWTLSPAVRAFVRVRILRFRHKQTGGSK